MANNIFSVPINPKLDPEFIKTEYLQFLIRNKDLIYDLYFTSRMPPFTQDAMGDVFYTQEMEYQCIDMALWLSKESGIPLSATFNNIYVRPDQKNLELWINNFESLYNAGIKIVTLPHTSWLLTGEIQKQYPDLYIKNTILREVTRPNEVIDLARAGFNYINLDRDLMRDRDRLNEIKEAKEYCAEQGYPIKLSLLTNEGCWGNCPVMVEHYQYNNTRNGDDPQYFNSRISRVSCSKWDALEGGLASLKAANLPPWREDWEEFLDVIDVFKMHGREDGMRLKETMDIIDRWRLEKELLFPEFKEYIEDVDIKERPIDVWRDKIKTCKFNCWKCNYCDKVYENGKGETKVNPKVEHIITAIHQAEQMSSNYTGVAIESLTSNITKHFLNNICSLTDTVYLELGCYAGGTFFAALQNNPSAKGYAVDNFKQPTYPNRDDLDFKGYENPKEVILQPPWHPDKKYDYTLIESDISSLYLPEKASVVFYDANHDPQSQYIALKHVYQYMEDEVILIIDDANMPGVVGSVDEFIRIQKPTVLFERKILTNKPEDDESWWNGLYILLLKK